jgi:tetratricopeptide (TPR) repeat protein
MNTISRARRWTFPLIIVLAGAATLLGAEDKSPAATLLESAVALEKAQRYDEALEKLRAAAALTPPPPLAAEIIFRTGDTLFRKGRDAYQAKIAVADPAAVLREAAKAFQDVLTRFPREAKAPAAAYLLGTSFLLLDDFEQALAAYKRVDEGYPGAQDRPLALIRIGICQAGLGNPTEARASFERFLKEFPNDKSEGPKVKRCLEELSLVGRPAPPLGGPWLREAVDRDAIKGFDGQVVVLVFFATWCPNTRLELPHLRALMKKWIPKNVVFLGAANPDDPQSTVPVDAYVEGNGLEFFDVALDRTPRTAIAYRVTGFPAAAIIDQKGTVVWRGHLAFFPNPMIEKLFKETKG